MLRDREGSFRGPRRRGERRLERIGRRCAVTTVLRIGGDRKNGTTHGAADRLRLGLDRAVRAAIAPHSVTVVALLSGRHDAVAASGRGTVRVTAVAAHRVAVIASLTGIERPVATVVTFASGAGMDDTF